MKYFIIASSFLFALDILLTLILPFAEKSVLPHRDMAPILFKTGWVAWGIFLLVSGQ